jgi:hypothetical protein
MSATLFEPLNAITRLAAMLGKKRLAAMLVIGAAATAMSACGSSDTSKTLSQEEANILRVKLAAVQTAEDTGKCAAIKATANDFVQAVNDLPETAGADVKTQLREAGENIETLATDPSNCQQPSGASGFTGTETTSSSTTSTIPTTTAPTTTATTTSSTTTSSTSEPPPSGGDGGAGTPPGQTGGGPPGQTGGGPPTGGGTGTGGTGTGGGGGTG